VGAGDASEIQRERSQHEDGDEERRAACSSRVLHRGPPPSSYARATELVWPLSEPKFAERKPLECPTEQCYVKSRSMNTKASGGYVRRSARQGEGSRHGCKGRTGASEALNDESVE
jgi:hypothetical protein